MVSSLPRGRVCQPEASEGGHVNPRACEHSSAARPTESWSWRFRSLAFGFLDSMRGLH